MSNYRSKMTTLRKLRTGERDAQRQRLADAMRAEQHLAEQATLIRAECEATQQRHREVRGNHFDVTALLEIERYELVLKTQTLALQKQLDVVAAEIERRRAELAAADQQVRVIEKLDDRRRREFERQARRREQVQLDEVATNQFLRQHS